MLILTACGGKSGEIETGTTAEKPQPKASASEDEATTKGEDIAKEILDIFNKAVAEAADMMKYKPEPADLKPELEALCHKYETIMTEISARYLALKYEDIASFGAANGYLEENRAKHVFNKDNTLGEFIAYYNF